MTNPFRTDLIDIFVRRGHKGKEIAEEVREIEALLDGQRCEWTHNAEYYPNLYHTSCGKVLSEDSLEQRPFCPFCGFKIEVKEVKDGQE